MSTAILSVRRRFDRIGMPFDPARAGQALAVVALASVVAFDPEVGQIAVRAVSDAYLQVSVFVAATLALFYAAERWFQVDTAAWMEAHRRWQVPAAALLGALPGCGGAVVVTTQYVRGQVGFGAMVAVLTATMGDAAFLLIAREPLTAVGVISLGLVIGIVSGYVVEALHGPGFMRQPLSAESGANCAVASRPASRLLGPWVALMVPGAVLGMALAFQVDVDGWIDRRFSFAAGLQPTLWFGFLGGLLSLAMWARQPAGGEGCAVADDPAIASKVAADTNFVTVWVVAAYLLFELSVHFSGVDFGQLFKVWAPAMPLMGVVAGLIPGCGPQIVVTSLYLAGAVPLSTQLGNAISNDGDALFPALAIAPRAAMMATLYSSIPALMVGYGWYWIFE
ncbi:putative manganese transporter [Endothiovibrio diazotrophicus]